jgi:hypothetical protein
MPSLAVQSVTNLNSSFAGSGNIGFGDPSGTPEEKMQYNHKVMWGTAFASSTESYCVASGSLENCTLGSKQLNNPIIEFTYLQSVAQVSKLPGTSNERDYTVTGVCGHVSDSSSGGLGYSAVNFFPSAVYVDPSAGGMGWTDSAHIRRTWSTVDTAGQDWFIWGQNETSGYILCMPDPTNGQESLKDDPMFTRIVFSYLVEGMKNPYLLKFKQGDGCPWDNLGEYYDSRYGQTSSWYKVPVSGRGIHLDSTVDFHQNLAQFHI